jgi:SAM-dependent methyltransferase
MTSRPTALAPALDPHDLYEICVTEPVRLTRFLVAVHGARPRVLREDFCGTGALARHWTRTIPRARAIAIDADPGVLTRASAPRVRTVCANVMNAHDRGDILAATNFSIGYWRSRTQLVAYLKHARDCLNPRGTFVCDTYGGRDAFRTLSLTQKFKGARGERIEYTFAQRDADAITGMVLDTLSFVVRPAVRAKPIRFPDAFAYRWRLWSIPELGDALRDAGFSHFDVYDRLGDAIDSRKRLHVRPATPPLDDNYVVYLVARR